jgi:hypothetical protein
MPSQSISSSTVVFKNGQQNKGENQSRIYFFWSLVILTFETQTYTAIIFNRQSSTLFCYFWILQKKQYNISFTGEKIHSVQYASIPVNNQCLAGQRNNVYADGAVLRRTGFAARNSENLKSRSVGKKAYSSVFFRCTQRLTG